MKLSNWDPDLRSLVKRIDDGDIDLQPNFQRQEVWPLQKKRRLIDTILRDWSIPPVHFVVTSDNRLEVLDGQQRLAAIRDFLNDRFSIDAKISPVDPSLSALNGKFYSQLDTSTKRRIDNYPIRAFRITEFQPDEPNELFYRLNQPVMLTAGEQRNALFGPAREQLKVLVEIFEKAGNTKEAIGFSNARMAYDDFIAKFLFFLEKRTFGIKSTEGLISDRFKVRSEFRSDIIARAERSIKLFTESRAYVTAYRFNKASILSWLIFFSRFEEKPNLRFMAEFSALKDKRAAFPLADAYALFENRSSLRVADVSSVVYRDFALWFSYYVLKLENIPTKVNVGKIASVLGTLKSRDDVSLEFVLSQHLSVESWGSSL